MSVLNDQSLRALYEDAAVQPASIDLHLGDSLLKLAYGMTIDPEQDQSERWGEMARRTDGRWSVERWSLHLGVTKETIAIPRDCVGVLHGISSLGRLGLLVHVTAGLADPGWTGRLTLELVSLGGTILLRPGQRIAQLTLHRLTGPAAEPYAGKYQNDLAPVPSRMYLEARP